MFKSYATTFYTCSYAQPLGLDPITCTCKSNKPLHAIYPSHDLVGFAATINYFTKFPVLNSHLLNYLLDGLRKEGWIKCICGSQHPEWFLLSILLVVLQVGLPANYIPGCLTVIQVRYYLDEIIAKLDWFSVHILRTINYHFTPILNKFNRTLYNARKNDLISKFCRLVLTKRVFNI